jgi:hypothetical protein
MMIAPFVISDLLRWQAVARLFWFGRGLMVRQAFKDFAI